MNRKYVLDGARLKCTFGASPARIKVTSQRKVYIQGKLKVTDMDKMLLPNFITCSCSWPSSPCTPVLQNWMVTSRKVTMGTKKFVMDDSFIMCSRGGLITIDDHTQRAGMLPGISLPVQLSTTIPLTPYFNPEIKTLKP
ncbi:MAG: DUF4280 domain-containing protein [Candidatus Symbiothrix sp.]|jgi:hypothetical protein|nr:DUF4280 domain-containing protein [Candidatus Symbiothrix sp.]